MVFDNIVLIGFMGSGKTSVGKTLSRELMREFVDVDSVIEKEQNASVREIFAKSSQEHFRTLEQKCIDELCEKSGRIISTGGGLPIYSQIPQNSLIINIDADFDIILARLSKKEREKRPLLEDEQSARALFEERQERYREIAHFNVDANQSIPTFIHIALDFILDKRIK